MRDEGADISKYHSVITSCDDTNLRLATRRFSEDRFINDQINNLRLVFGESALTNLLVGDRVYSLLVRALSWWKVTMTSLHV